MERTSLFLSSAFHEYKSEKTRLSTNFILCCSCALADIFSNFHFSFTSWIFLNNLWEDKKKKQNKPQNQKTNTQN